MDHCAVAYEQNLCSDESEMMLQWFNSQYFNQTMPMQPDFLPLHEDSSNNSFPHSEIYNADPCNLYEFDSINFSFLPSLGHENYQQDMECMPEDPHSISYLDVGFKERHMSQVFTNEVIETENVLDRKGKRKLKINSYEKQSNDDSECISNNVPRKKSRSSVRVSFFLIFITLSTID